MKTENSKSILICLDDLRRRCAGKNDEIVTAFQLVADEITKVLSQNKHLENCQLTVSRGDEDYLLKVAFRTQE